MPFLLLTVSVVADDSPSSDHVPGPSLNIQEILDEWKRQASIVGDFQIELVVQHHARSESFGGSPEVLPSSSQIAVSRSGDLLLLETPAASPPSLTGITRVDRFSEEAYQKALESHFQGPYRFLQALNYQVARGLDVEQHLWSDSPPGQSIAVLCRPGESLACFKAPLTSYVLEAFANVCVLPIGARHTATVEYQLTPELKSVSGRSCQIVQIWKQEKTKRRIVRELWIESESGYRIRRCIIPGLEPVMIHLEYLPDSKSPLPDRITAIRLTETGDVNDELVAAISPHRLATTSTVMKPIPKHTVVSDFILSQRKIAIGNGTFRKVSTSDILVEGSVSSTTSFWQKLVGRRWDLTLIHWLKWPRILIPLGLAGIVCYCSKKVFSRHRARQISNNIEIAGTNGNEMKNDGS